MRKAEREDMDRVVHIITSTFQSNPGVKWLLRPGSNPVRQIGRLARYAFLKAFNRGGAYLSDDQQGVALCFPFDARKVSLLEWWSELKFAFLSIGIRRLPRVLRRESYRRRIRPADGHYLYFWFLGVTREGSGSGFELCRGIKEEAWKQRLPVYLETSVERNKQVYERMGFRTYHTWKDPAAKIQFWFMKWEPYALNQ